MAKSPKTAVNHTFILNDEGQVNSYDFRVPNAALKLDRFRNNPVILDSHYDGTVSVVGRWLNPRIEGSQLLADAEFDMGDPAAASLAGKVERGFVKGCSIGFIPTGFNKAKDGVLELTGGELMEASICAIPANATALKLYAPNGVRLTADEIKLSVSHALSTSTPKSPQHSMKGLKLTIPALTALGLTDQVQEGDELSLARGIEKLCADLAAEKLRADNAETKVADTVKLQGKTMLDTAQAEGRFLPTERGEYEQLAAANIELCAKTIARLPAKVSLSGQVDNPAGDAGAPADLEAFMKLSTEAQLAFKKTNPAAYSALVK